MYSNPGSTSHNTACMAFYMRIVLNCGNQNDIKKCNIIRDLRFFWVVLLGDYLFFPETICTSLTGILSVLQGGGGHPEGDS